MSRQPSLADRFPNRPRPSRSGRLKALGLAVVVHLGLLAMLVVGVSWKSSEPPPVMAELWTPAPAVEQPRPVPEPQPEPTPEPPPEPKPEPKPEPRPEPQPEPPPPQPDPQIAIEKAKREAEEKRRAEEARRAEEERKRKAAEEQRRAEEQKRKAEEERERLALERKRKAEEERQKKLAEERKRKEEEERQKKLAEERKRKAAEQARREREEAERRRAEYLERLQQAAAGSETGAPGGAPTGGAGGARASVGGTGTDSGYQARVAAAIRASTHYVIPSGLTGNPKAEFAVRLRDDCTVASVTLRKSSGHPDWDAAAERGIQRTDPFPRQADGTCPSSLTILRGPRDD